MIKTVCLLFTLTTILSAQPLAEGKSKFLGNALGEVIFSNFTNYWNQLTPGNAGKWGHVELGRDYYTWDHLDALYNLAVQNEIPFKHHTAIWGNQQPGWINSLPVDEQREEIEEWISLVAARYPLVAQVDVVNEPLHAPPDYKAALGGNGATGWDWVITSFELAREYYPDSTELLINEYNILQSIGETDRYIDIIELLMARDLIDGIGIQGHYFEFKSAEGQTPSYEYDIGTIKSNLDRLAELGLPIYITEFDIDEPDDDIQLENYQTYFPIFWEHPAVAGITLWGYMEGYIWQPDAYVLDWSGRPRPSMDWLEVYIKTPNVPQIVSPVSQTDVQINPVLTWEKTEGADTYNVQLTRSRSFSPLIMDTVVTDTMIQVDTLNSDTRYYWRVRANNDSGTSYFSEQAFFITETITGIENSNHTPAEYQLFQNYPNPFNPNTTIKYSIGNAETGHAPSLQLVNLAVYDMLGREVATLVNEYQRPGTYKVNFNASGLTSGIYFYRLSARTIVEVKQMMLMK